MPELVDLIEKHMADSIARVAADISDHLGIPDFADQARAILQPQIRPWAQALAASLAAGETAEQFEERLAALKVEES